MNLHKIVRGAITSVSADIPCLLFVSTGKTAVLLRGDTAPLFADGIPVRAQFQSKSPDAMTLANKVEATTTTRRIYLFAEDKPASRPWAQWRPLGRSGDYIKDPHGDYWLITAVLEDFSYEGWVSVEAVLQTTPVRLQLEPEATP